MAIAIKRPLAELDLLDIWDFIIDVIRVLRGSRDLEEIFRQN